MSQAYVVAPMVQSVGQSEIGWAGLENTMAAEEPTEEIRKMLWEMLLERFGDEFEFGPIVVRPRVDHDGDDYLHSYIVFKGDQKKLDPKWTLRLSGRLWDRAEELGYPGIPIQSFVEKSEWPALEKHLV